MFMKLLGYVLTFKDISLLQCNYMYMGNGVLPINNKFIAVKNLECQHVDYYDINNLTENCFFSSSDSVTRGITWNKNLKPKLNEWYLSFEHSLGNIKPLNKICTEPIKLTLNTFKTWNEFRDYALGHKNLCKPNLVNDLEICINKGNHFVNSEFPIEVIQNRLQDLKGEFTVDSIKKSIDACVKSSNEEYSGEMFISINEKYNNRLDILNIEVDLPVNSWLEKRAIFNIKNTNISKEIIEERGQKVYEVNNGVMIIKCCPSFSPALHFLEYNNVQWLENSFPIAKTKSWYNPWFGGIFTKPENLSMLENVTLPNKERRFKELVFYIFTDEYIDEFCLRDLRNVHFGGK